MVTNAGQLLTERAKASPQLAAVIDAENGTVLSFAELNADTNRLAHTLLGFTIKPGDRVGLLMSNGLWYVRAYYALAKIGAISVLLNWRLTPEELAFQIEDAEISTLIYSPDHIELSEPLMQRFPKLTALQIAGKPVSSSPVLERVAATMAADEPLPGASGDDVEFLMYTSGTTGKPKGAMHTHNSTIGWSQCALATTEMRLGDRGLVLAPLFHIGGLALLISYVHRGVTSVIAKSFDAENVWRLIATERINHTFAVPAMLNSMYQHPLRQTSDHQSLRWIMVGAAPVALSSIEAYAALGIDIYQVFGSTETHGGICIIDPEHARSKAGSTGRAYFGLEVRVVDGEGRDVVPGVPGEVITRGPHLFKGYWNRPEVNERAFKDGWFYLGDVAVVDADGFISIKDRSTDTIISGGENIYPAEVEDVLMRHPAVREVAVIAQPSRRWGESPVAVVVADPAQIAAGTSQLKCELLEICAQRLARYKHPRALEFVETLPRNATGKVLKRLLRERFPGPTDG
jgi:acyl-CoA synthetase (AMP-forming)/AMP-acid ligase II